VSTILHTVLPSNRTTIRWIRKKNKGYLFKNNKKINIPILTYMDDIVIISQNKNDLDKIIKKLNKYFSHYKMEVSRKSVYTNNKKEEEMKEIYIQNTKVQTIKSNKAYKYLGFWTTVDNN
jgi:Reverse transcriptase (RNA-dependent DNA polymerase)